MDQSEVITHAFRSIKWATLGNILPRVVTPISTLILAAILTPNDFGVVAAATLVITLAQIVVGLGIGVAIIQRQTDIEETASIGFWMGLIFALAMYILLWVLAPLLANFYHIQVLTYVIPVSGLSLLLYALISIPNALLQKKMAFRELFFIGVIPQIVTATSTVVLAWLKGTYWSLVIGQLLGLCTGVILTWNACHWRPCLNIKWQKAWSLFQFSIWVLLSNLQSWLFLYFDNSVAGYFFGAGGLGLYSFGFNISALIPGLIISPIASVAYPTFCNFNNNKYLIGRALLKLQCMSAVILFPMCFGLSAIANSVVYLLYGDRWQGLGMIIQWLSIMPGTAYIWSLNADAYRAIGKPMIWTISSTIALIILIPGLILTGFAGSMEIFVIVRFLGALILPVLCLFLTSIIFNIKLKEQIQKLSIPLFSSVLVYFFIHQLASLFVTDRGFLSWVKLSIIILIGVIIYGGLIYIWAHELWIQLITIAKQLLFPNAGINEKYEL